MPDQEATRPVLRVEDLSFSYGSRKVLDGIDLVVNRGEILALLGPNESGKSTLLRCLNGFLRIDGGRVLLDGQDIRCMKRRLIAQRIAFLPQSLETVNYISIRELVAMGRSPHRALNWLSGKRDRELVDWAIEYMDLGSLSDRRLERASGGERQRAWIAMILAQDTDIVLLDEPITYLDLKHQWNLIRIIKQIQAEFGTTFILVLHDINQAMTSADRFVILRKGNVRAHGQGRDIVTRHMLKDVYEVDARVCHYSELAHPFVLPSEHVEV